MKLLCSGSDFARIDLVRRKLVDSHIACEIRPLPSQEEDEIPAYPELWILHDRDFSAASRVFVRFGCVPLANGARPVR